MFNGFLPCPLVYGFLIKAMFESSPLKGATVMILFGIGTVPAMVFSSYLFKRFSPSLRKKLSSMSGIIIILFGVLAIFRAFGIGHNH